MNKRLNPPIVSLQNLSLAFNAKYKHLIKINLFKKLIKKLIKQLIPIT